MEDPMTVHQRPPRGSVASLARFIGSLVLADEAHHRIRPAVDMEPLAVAHAVAVGRDVDHVAGCTRDLQVMSLTRYCSSIPRKWCADPGSNGDARRHGVLSPRVSAEFHHRRMLVGQVGFEPTRKALLRRTHLPIVLLA